MNNKSLVKSICYFVEIQIGSPLEEELRNWGHHSHPSTVPDVILQAAAGDEVSFSIQLVSLTMTSEKII